MFEIIMNLFRRWKINDAKFVYYVVAQTSKLKLDNDKTISYFPSSKCTRPNTIETENRRVLVLTCAMFTVRLVRDVAIYCYLHKTLT